MPRGPLLRVVVLWMVIGTCGIGVAPPAAAQVPDAPKRVSVSLFGQTDLGTPGRDFDAALRLATLDDNYCPLAIPGSSCEARPTPVSSGGRLAYGFALGYPLTPAWEVRAVVRAEEAVEAYGVRQDLYRVQLSTEAGSRRYAVSLAFHPPMARFLHVGFGPALCDAEVRGRDDWTRFAANGGSKFGFVVDGGARYPSRSRLFADLGMQYWHAGDMTFGPYNVRNGIGNIQVYFPASPYSLNRLDATLGVGVRL